MLANLSLAHLQDILHTQSNVEQSISFSGGLSKLLHPELFVSRITKDQPSGFSFFCWASIISKPRLQANPTAILTGPSD